MTQNSTAELCLTALNINVKSEGKLTFASKNDMRGLRNFHQSTWKSPNWDFDGILLSKVENAWAQNLQGRRVICHENKEWWKIRGGIDLSFQNWHEEFDKFWPEHLKISKTYTLMGSFWSKYIMFERSYIWWQWRLMQNLKENWFVLSKMTWKICQIFAHRMKNSDFILESKMAELN